MKLEAIKRTNINLWRNINFRSSKVINTLIDYYRLTLNKFILLVIMQFMTFDKI